MSSKMLAEIVGSYPDREILKADGFDDALMGYAEGEDRLVYSVRKCIEILMERDGMSEEEAVEFFDFEVAGSYVGDRTLVWVYDDFMDGD